MNTKYLAIILAIIIIVASAVGYLAYTGALNANPKASPTPQPTATPQTVTLTIFAASSLTNAIANMTAAFDKQYDCNIVVNSGSSSMLEQQVVAGAPCDVFMSADIKWTNALSSLNLIYNSQSTNFTTNKLCLIIAQGNPKNITSLADLSFYCNRHK